MISVQCGGDLTADSGEIQSPNFPRVYPDEANCEWKIEVHNGSRITLTFEEFQVTWRHSCPLWYLLRITSDFRRSYILLQDSGESKPTNIKHLSSKTFKKTIQTSTPSQSMIDLFSFVFLSIQLSQSNVLCSD